MSRDSRALRERTATTGFAQLSALYVKAAAADAEELDSMIEEANTTTDLAARRSALEVLLLRYAEIDADRALTIALTADRRIGASLLGRLAQVAPLRAWQRLATIEDTSLRNTYRGAVAASWAAQQPEAAFAEVTRLPPDTQRDELLQQVAVEVARRDPQLAIELTRTVDARNAALLLGFIAEEWASYDPAAAASWIEPMDPGRQAPLAYRIAEAYVAQQPEAALAWALRISRSPGRNLWSYMLGRMALDNPQEALRIAQAAESPAQRSQAISSVLSAVGARDPAFALSQLTKVPRYMREQLVTQIATRMVETSPGTAVDLLSKLDDAGGIASATYRLAEVLSARDVELAASLVDRVPHGGRQAWISRVALAYVEQDLDKGRDFVLKHQGKGGGVLQLFARDVANQNVDRAVELVERTADQQERDQLLIGMVPVLAMQSPESAARWSERITNREARRQAVETVARTWAQYDAPAARRWVTSLSDGQERDTAVARIVADSRSLDEALTWVGQIDSLETRMDTVMMAAMRIAQTDPDGARSLLRRYPLDPGRQAQFDGFVRSNQ